ncbi:MAG TPA: FecR domain-containing protein [Terriglobales bacterium]|nr:FecR domain-containing protein [Terriglobales bacterium]
MNRNAKDFNKILDRAIAALRDDQPDAPTAQKAMDNAWQHITQAVGAQAASAAIDRIEGCADVLRLLPEYHAKRLSAARVLLVEDHLRECATCRVQAEQNRSKDSVLPWHADSVLRPRHWNLGQYALAATVVVAAAVGLWIGTSGILAPSGPRASLASIDGTLYRVDASGEHRANVGEQFGEGEMVRTAAGSRAMLRLRDGSMVEMNGRSELYVSLSRRNTTVHLDRGIVIVEAAKRHSGHLYVKTPDARVSVTGTIFAVNAGIKGSRVSVIEGVVHVDQASGESVLHAGDQSTSAASMEDSGVRQEISWSENRDKYFALLAELSTLQKKLQRIKMPDLRYESRLLNVVPDSTVFYAAVPNYGEALAQANRLFQQELSQSDVLREWWQRGPGKGNGSADFNKAIALIHNLSEYLGNEIVVSGLGDPGNTGGIVAVAQVVRPGLKEFLAQQIAQAGPDSGNVHLLSPEELGTAPDNSGHSFYVLIGSDFVAASPNPALLRAAYSRWSQGANSSGFAQSDFGQRIASEYSSGAGLLLAVNLGQMEQSQVESAGNAHGHRMLELTGFSNVRYLIAERKDLGNTASNTAELSFSGARQGVASWLAAPAPIGALDFISPDASAVGAFVSKNPAAMVDDVMQMLETGDAQAASKWAQEQSELNLDIRNDLAASLGGDAALALDGPLLPTPSWKLVVEVYDPSRLEYSLGRLVDDATREAQKNGHAGLALEQNQAGGRTFYTIRSLSPKEPIEFHYTFADGYWIVGPTQAMVQQAIRTRESGHSISHSEKFRALFPSDQHTNVSGLIYQNLAPVIGPIASQISASQLRSLQTIVSNSEPSIICAYGDENQIEIASNSKTLGIDFKTLAISAVLDELKGTRTATVP